jgi:gamma-glutamyltranspeptidase/glutathione hydrolase
MLAILESAEISDETSRLRAIVEAQSAAMGYRRDRYLEPADVAAAFGEALESLKRRSAATTHSSAADSSGYACSLTESNGYGSGIVVEGMLMNNTLGEEELNPRGAHRLPPGSRCHSNMAPTIVTGPGRTIALGSPGADRIVPAIAQTILRLAEGASVADAVGGPRAYLDVRPEGETLCFEPGLPGEELDYIPRPYDRLHMFFGGVQAASVSSAGEVDAVHDPRRSGGSAIL